MRATRPGQLHPLIISKICKFSTEQAIGNYPASWVLKSLLIIITDKIIRYYFRHIYIYFVSADRPYLKVYLFIKTP